MFRYLYRVAKADAVVLSVLQESGYTGQISFRTRDVEIFTLGTARELQQDRESGKPIKSLTPDELHRRRCRVFILSQGGRRFVGRYQPAASAEEIGLQKLQIE